MDEATFRAMLLRQFDQANTDPDTSHDMYHDDAVLEFPQSGERFEGVENFREWRSIYPAEVTYEIHEIHGRDDLWIVEVSVSYDGGPPELRRQHPRASGRQDRARDDLRRRGLGRTRVAPEVESRAVASACQSLDSIG